MRKCGDIKKLYNEFRWLRKNMLTFSERTIYELILVFHKDVLFYWSMPSASSSSNFDENIFLGSEEGSYLSIEGQVSMT